MSWGLLPRQPDEIIGGIDNPYMLRWFVIPKNRWINVYLHKFLRSDENGVLHDHPWWNCSIVLKGRYIEHRPYSKFATTIAFRRAGSIVFRKAEQAHRIQLLRTSGPVMYWLVPSGMKAYSEPTPAWSLFITGPKVREWGFHCPEGWRHWTEFCDPIDPGKVGPGYE